MYMYRLGIICMASPNGCILCVYHFLLLELEEMSSQPVKKRGCQMSRSEAKFIAGLIETHGTDYKVSVVC